MVNVLRHFVPRLALWCAPFYDLVATRAVEDWKVVDLQFRQLWSNILAQAMVLTRSETNVQFNLYMDWSGEGASFVLMDRGKIVACGFRRNTIWKNKVSSFLGEMDTLVWALKEVKGIVKGKQLVVRTDAQAVVHKLNNKDD